MAIMAGSTNRNNQTQWHSSHQLRHSHQCILHPNLLPYIHRNHKEGRDSHISKCRNATRHQSLIWEVRLGLDRGWSTNTMKCPNPLSHFPSCARLVFNNCEKSECVANKG